MICSKDGKAFLNSNRVALSINLHIGSIVFSEIIEHNVLETMCQLNQTSRDQHVHFEPIETGLDKSPKWRHGLHLRSKCQMKFDAAPNDFNSCQFKKRMKKITAQVDFCLFLIAFLFCLQFGA